MSRREILAKCAAKDGYSINSIRGCEAIKGFLKSKRFEMPGSNETIWSDIEDFYNEQYTKMFDELRGTMSKETNL